MKFIENLKHKNWQKLLFLLIFMFLIILPIVVVGLNKEREGWKMYNNTLLEITGTQEIGESVTQVCLDSLDYNNTNDYFIPDKTANEWAQFKANKPSSIHISSSCCPDGVCAGGENCATCYEDCGSCACTVSADCGIRYPEWQDPWSCSGNNIRGYKNGYKCESYQCLTTSILNTYGTCGGGENSRCRTGYNTCGTYCTGGSDDDGDGYADAKDSDCGGCNFLECQSDPYCNTITNCFNNGVTCGPGMKSISGTCQCVTGAYRSRSNNCITCTAQASAGAYLTLESSYSCRSGYGVIRNSCPKGSYNPVENPGESCKVCPSGTYSGIGANSCTQCAVGYYCPRGIQIPCPSGKTSDAGAGTIQGCYSTGT